MPPRVRRQHLVSRFYLNGFAAAGRIWRVALPSNEQRSCSTTDVSVQRDFYNVTLPDGLTTDYFEHMFAKIEATVSPAFRNLTPSQPVWPVRGEERVAVATWVALQALRGDRIRGQMREQDASVIRLIVGASGKNALRSIIERAEGQAISDEDLRAEWDDITKPGGPDLVPDPDSHLRMLMDLLPDVAQSFANRRWTLWTFQRKRLATSDHPVSLLAPEGHPHYRGVGLFNAGGIVLPVNRAVGLTMTIEPGPEAVVPGSTDMARTFNGKTIHNARRCVYHHPDDQPLTGFNLPEPRDAELDTRGATHFVSEGGLFTHMEDDPVQAEAFERMSAADPDRDDDGITIDDLPWPIPGRRSNVVRSQPSVPPVYAPDE